MSRRKLTPQEKKELAYAKDHYNRGGESLQAWRRTKPRKKRKAVRSYRRKLRMQLQNLHEGRDEGIAANRSLGNPRQKVIKDWGPISLREFVKSRRARNQVGRR